MIYLELFITFFKIGLFTFGGGYAMIPLIQQEVFAKGWLSEDILYNFIGISESTPGPIAVNLATFIGSSQGGFLGGICATLGVVLPSFIIILLIAAVLKSFDKNRIVKAVLSGVRPIITGLIIASGLLIIIKNVIVNIKTFSNFSVDYKTLIIMLILTAIIMLGKKILKKDFSPIIIILAGGVLGLLFFS